MPENVIIIGAAGRDFHNFNVFFRDNEHYRVRAFTASQIPYIDDRRYPPSLSGGLYPDGIEVTEFEQIEELIRKHSVTTCFFSYSDISYTDLMGIASRVISAGVNFTLLSPAMTQIKAGVPVISVVAVRTGSGKSQTTRRVAEILKLAGKRTAVIRHPMPYGDLESARVQRFETIEDMKSQGCTIEEMEEYEPHIAAGYTVWAGVDYGEIIREAEKDADVVLWDGGNNDVSFFKSDLTICVADPLRAGNEVTHYPGEINLRLADLVIINKVDSATREEVAAVRSNIEARNPGARIIEAESPVSVDDPGEITGKRVLIVEDGPTLTHGNMAFGAGYVAAKKWGASEIIRPEPFAVGSLKQAYAKFPQLEEVLPALGYSDEQLGELEASIRNAEPEVVLIGTPIDLSRVIKIDPPAVRVTYSLAEKDPEVLRKAVLSVLEDFL